MSKNNLDSSLQKFLSEIPSAPTIPNPPEVLFTAEEQDKDLEAWLKTLPVSNAPNDEAATWLSTFEASLGERWKRMKRDRSN